MAKFIDVHPGMTGLTREQLAEAHAADLAIEGEEGVHFERAWADPAAGVVYCLSDAPDAEAVRRVHQRTGHPAANPRCRGSGRIAPPCRGYPRRP